MIKPARWFIGQYTDGGYTSPQTLDWAGRVLLMFSEPKKWRSIREHFGLTIRYGFGKYIHISLFSHRIQ